MMSSSPPAGAPFALARYRDGEAVRLGLVRGDRIRPIASDELGAPTLNDFLAAADWSRLQHLAESAADGWRALSEVTLTAPVEPRQVVQTGANYRTHVIDLVVAGRAKDDPRPEAEVREEVGRMMDERGASGEPYFFQGRPACVVGDDVPLVLPGYSHQHDWELELAVVIGREAFRVSREDALSYAAGYTIVNDVTTRDLVFRKDVGAMGADWYRAKNAPGFLPTGPFLVPAAFVDPSDLAVRLELNGQVMQDATTADLLFDVPALIAGASATSPLFPGDLLLTGSPAGNGAHWGRLLRDGDTMTGSITGLGTQTVHCVAEQENAR